MIAGQVKKLIVVSDAGPLIALAGCGQLNLLTSVFESIHIPAAVLAETTADLKLGGAMEISAFVQTHAKVHPSRDDDTYKQLITYLDEGEAQAIRLAQVLQCTLLIDERIGRQAAQRQGVDFLGTVGVLLQAKRIGKLTKIAPSLSQMQNNGYRLSSELVQEALRIARE